MSCSSPDFHIHLKGLVLLFGNHWLAWNIKSCYGQALFNNSRAGFIMCYMSISSLLPWFSVMDSSLGKVSSCRKNKPQDGAAVKLPRYLAAEGRRVWSLGFPVFWWSLEGPTVLSEMVINYTEQPHALLRLTELRVTCTCSSFLSCILE